MTFCHNRLGRRCRLGFVVGLATLCAVSFRAGAVVDANSSSNTNAPADGAPWLNVGEIGGGPSGVYLGGGWVLTASHVGVGSIVLVNSTFTPDGTSLRLTNADGTATDLVMFHLSAFPPLPSIPLVTSTPAAFAQIDMIGFGLIAGSAQTNFGAYSGFYWGASHKSWGNNKVNLGGVTTINAGYGNISVFATDFTAPGTIGPASQTSDEAQVAPGDSGGAAFQKVGSVWQLAGILDAEQFLVNQPGSTAVYGDKSYAADIATYRSQIEGVLSATPIPQVSIKSSGTNALVCWPDMGVSYTLQANNFLGKTGWTAVSQAQFSTNGQICTMVPNNGALQFFRLQKP